MTKGTARTFSASANQRMANGYTITTGKNSYCWLKLDEDSIVKADQNTKLQFAEAKGNKLSISVLSGAITVNAAAQKPGDAVEVRAGNSALSIRGTLFVVENSPDDKATITMLSGSGDVNGVTLTAGEIMHIFDTLEEKMFEKQELMVDENLSLPVLEAIAENINELSEMGFVDAEQLEQMNTLLNELIEEKQAQAEAEAAAEEEEEPVEDIERLEEPAPDDNSDSGDDDGGGSGSTAPPAPSVADMISALGNGDVLNITTPMTIGAGETATLADGAEVNIFSTLTVAANASLTVQSGGHIYNYSSYTFNINGTVTNYGLIHSSSAGTTNINSGGKLENYADFSADNGAIVNNNGTVSGNGVDDLTAPGKYIFSSSGWVEPVAQAGGAYYATLGDAISNGSGNITLLASDSFSGPTTLSGRNLTINSGVTLTVNWTVTIDGGATLTNNGNINLDNVLNIGSNDTSGVLFNNGVITGGGTAGGTLKITNTGSEATNNGSIINMGYLSLDKGTMTNEAGKTIQIVYNASNYGMSINQNTTFTNSGIITINSSTELKIFSDAKLTNNNGGQINNSGTIEVSTSGEIENYGTITCPDTGIITGSGSAKIEITGGSVEVKAGEPALSAPGTLTWNGASWQPTPAP